MPRPPERTNRQRINQSTHSLAQIEMGGLEPSMALDVFFVDALTRRQAKKTASVTLGVVSSLGLS